MMTKLLRKSFLKIIYVGSIVIWTFAIGLMGGVIVLIFGVIAEAAPGWIKAYYSLPLWGTWIVDLVVGLIVYGLYKKLPEPKDTQD